MTEFDKIGQRPPGWVLAHRAAGAARFGWGGLRHVLPAAGLTNLREPRLRLGFNQHLWMQSASRLLAASRGWLAGEYDRSFHPDKPSLIRLAAGMGGGVRGLRRVGSSGEETGSVPSPAPMDLTSRSDEHATSAPWSRCGDYRKSSLHRDNALVACR